MASSFHVFHLLVLLGKVSLLLIVFFGVLLHLWSLRPQGDDSRVLSGSHSIWCKITELLIESVIILYVGWLRCSTSLHQAVNVLVQLLPSWSKLLGLLVSPCMLWRLWLLSLPMMFNISLVRRRPLRVHIREPGCRVVLLVSGEHMVSELLVQRLELAAHHLPDLLLEPAADDQIVDAVVSLGGHVGHLLLQHAVGGAQPLHLRDISFFAPELSFFFFLQVLELHPQVQGFTTGPLIDRRRHRLRHGDLLLPQLFAFRFGDVQFLVELGDGFVLVLDLEADG